MHESQFSALINTRWRCRRSALIDSAVDLAEAQICRLRIPLVMADRFRALDACSIQCPKLRLFSKAMKKCKPTSGILDRSKKEQEKK